GPADRLALARWLVDGRHPLTARVTVNRIWQHYFGVGFVKTPEDFGSQGEPPTHPQLPDWLAVEFVKSGWDMKRLHRLIVTSAVYRQSSHVTPALAARDPQNVLLARGPRFRLSAFALRDQALALSGLLVEQMGGPPVQPYQPDGVWQDFSLGKIKYEQDHGDKLYRRSLYTFWRRSVGPTMLFDVSDRLVCNVRPRRTNTPLHALTMLNDVTYVEAARKFGERMVTEGGDLPAERLAWGFRLATARHPQAAELDVLERSLTRARTKFTADAAAAKALLGVGESPHNERLPPAELAAYATVAEVIMNLDEVVTKE
ncbi:MAG: DUF1553 domain-containing protein, partial [Planctomycetales bacterium]|nr:DUF1553 domain-containing protein [Planctomycetales bacterium]